MRHVMSDGMEGPDSSTIEKWGRAVSVCAKRYPSGLLRQRSGALHCAGGRGMGAVHGACDKQHLSTINGSLWLQIRTDMQSL